MSENTDANSQESGAGVAPAQREVPRFRLTAIRLNILVIALLITCITFGLIAVLWKALGQPGDNSFIIGALIGLVGGGITGLVSLGTTLLNDR